MVGQRDLVERRGQIELGIEKLGRNPVEQLIHALGADRVQRDAHVGVGVRRVAHYDSSSQTAR